MTQSQSQPQAASSLSALMDSELTGAEQTLAMSWLLADPAAQTTWHAYHLVGDVLRTDVLATSADDFAFLARLQQKISLEPAASGTSSIAFPAPTVLPGDKAVPVPTDQRPQSANAPSFGPLRWAGAAFTVAMAVVAGAVWAPLSTSLPSSSASLAALGTTGSAKADNAGTEVALGADGMLRDPRLDQLINAHQQLGGHSALQMPSGFLRNATYEGAAR